MPTLRLALLGPPPIRDGETDLYLAAQKAQALLYYLAAHPGRAFSRAHLITLLWEESPDHEGRNSLSTVLTRLRHALPLFPIAEAQGDTVKATAHLRAARDAFTAMEMHWDVE